MFRFVSLALPLLILFLAVFGLLVPFLGLEPSAGSVIRIALLDQPRVPGQVVLTAWLMEACGLLALYLLAQGRFTWWLDGLVAGWLAWIFRGPLFVLTVVVATRQPQGPWWRLALAWWILYTVCGLALAFLARRQGLVGPEPVPSVDVAAVEQEIEDARRRDAETRDFVRELPPIDAEKPDEPGEEIAADDGSPGDDVADRGDTAGTSAPTDADGGTDGDDPVPADAADDGTDAADTAGSERARDPS